jgi:hypothetical protein
MPFSRTNRALGAQFVRENEVGQPYGVVADPVESGGCVPHAIDLQF